jgi:uncharacterized protein YndB with AHSA1/START domain
MPQSALATVTTCYTLEWVRQSRHSPERVWHAITDPAELSVWMDNPIRIEPRVGGSIRFDFTREGEYIDGIVVELVPERILMHSWERSLVRWELSPATDGTTVRFIHHGLSRDDAIDVGPGWQEFLDQLENHLDGRALAPYEQRVVDCAGLQRPYIERIDTATLS